MGRRYARAFELLHSNLYFSQTPIVLEFRVFGHIDPPLSANITETPATFGISVGRRR